MSQDFYIIYGISGALLVLFGFLVWQYWQLKRKLDIFLKRGKKDLGKVLAELLQDLDKQEEKIKKILKRIKHLEKISQISFQKVGLLRYSPFKGVGGDQSFSLALLDKENSGFVITSLYMKERTRVFVKPINKGETKHPLSEGEKKVIAKAKGL